MKIMPITITIRNGHQLDAIRYALEINIDIGADTLTDAIPLQPQTIREMAGLSDEELKARLKEIHDDVNNRAEQLEALQDLYSQVNNADVISLETK